MSLKRKPESSHFQIGLLLRKVILLEILCLDDDHLYFRLKLVTLPCCSNHRRDVNRYYCQFVFYTSGLQNDIRQRR